MEEKYIVGLMSGTSLDGIDAALVKICGNGVDTKVELIAFCELDLPLEVKDKIKAVCNPETSTVNDICSLNFEIGYLFAEATKKVCEKANFPIEKLDLIGSHGQTIYHIPIAGELGVASTLQIGEAAVIAYETKTPVVSNFRVMDIAAGGQGAPLVPYTEYLLYRSEHARCLQNIGGIGNVTVLPAHATLDELVAFDTGPGNMIIDEVVLKTKGLKYDKGGMLAKAGQMDKPLFDELMAIPYVTMQPPKTTGRELYGKEFVEGLLAKYTDVKAEDLIHTVTAYTAETIATNYKLFVMPHYAIKEVILGGGGSYNDTLVQMIQERLPEVKVMTQEQLGHSSAAKEAIAFALLANETLAGNAGNVIGATGARERVVLGNITPWNKTTCI